MSELWTVTFDNTSPLISYAPHGDGGTGDQTSTGWQPWFSDLGFNKDGGEYGSGESLQITALSGASFDFQFYGTGITLYGSANCSFEVRLDEDGKTFDPASSSTIYQNTDLPLKTHKLTLKVDASDTKRFAFDRAEVTRAFSGGKQPAKDTHPVTDTSFIHYSGAWEGPQNNHQIPNEQHPAPYNRVTKPPASLSFSFEGQAIAVNGARNWGGSEYTVTLDDVSSTYNGSTMWLMGDTLLFYQDGLDAGTTHNVVITPSLAQEGYNNFWLNSITVFSQDNSTSPDPSPSPAGPNPPPESASSTPSTKHTNVGAIVGPIVGVVFVLAVAAALLYRRHRRRQMVQSDAQQPTPFGVFDDAEKAATPPVTGSGVGVLPTPAPSLPRKLARELAAVNMSSPSVVPASVGSPSASSAQAAPPPPASTISTQSASQPPASASTVPAAENASPLAPSQSSTSFSSDPNPAVVDRLVQLITERIEQTRPLHYDPEIPPPQYDEH